MFKDNNIFLDLIVNCVGLFNSGGFACVRIQLNHDKAHGRDQMAAVIVLKVWHGKLPKKLIFVDLTQYVVFAYAFALD